MIICVQSGSVKIYDDESELSAWVEETQLKHGVLCRIKITKPSLTIIKYEILNSNDYVLTRVIGMITDSIDKCILEEKPE